MKFKKVLKYVLTFLLLIGVSFLYSFTKARNSQKIVQEIEVEFEAGTNNFLTHAMVNKMLVQNNETVKNKTKSVLDLNGLENSVLKNPYVEKAVVYCTIEGALKTRIKQRDPVARILAGSGAYYIDKQGLPFPLSSNFSARVLLVSGVNKIEEVAEIVPLITAIIKDDFLKKEVIAIVKLEENEYQFSVRSGNYKIDFGKITEIDGKFKKLKAFYNNVFENKTIANYKTINVKYHNQVVCSK